MECGITNLSYWGFKTSISLSELWQQKSLDEAQKGMIFAGFLKILMPLIVVIPGIAALVIVNNGMDASFISSMEDPATGLIKSDRGLPNAFAITSGRIERPCFCCFDGGHRVFFGFHGQ